MFKSWGIRKKYFIAFFTIVILPIFIIGVIFYKEYRSVMMERFSYNTEEILKNIRNSIENEADNNRLVISSILKENIFINGEYINICDLITIWSKTSDSYEKEMLGNVINNALDGFLNYEDEIEGIVFYLKDGSFYSYRYYEGIDANKVRASSWYKRSLINKGVAYTLNSSKDEVTGLYEGNILSNSIGVNGDDKNNVELVYMSVKTDVFKNIYSDHSNNTVVMDVDQNIISSGEKDSIGVSINGYAKHFVKKDNIYRYDDCEFLISRVEIQSLKWTILNFTNYKIFIEDISKINIITMIFFMIIISSFIIFSLFFFRGIMNPIQHLISRMRKVKSGDLNVLIEVDSNDEIGELSRNFNSMIKDIDRLIIENSKKEREKSELEIEALQAQINPHFISNTLSAIRFMAMISKVNSIKEMTEAFINVTSSSFNRDNKFITLEKEFEILKSYVYIMRVRHGNKYDVFFELSDDVKNEEILKMLIQPILENSIVHGVSGLKENNGNIFVRAYRENEDILIEVEDNGVGIDKEKIEHLLSKDCRNDKGFTSIGIRNVDRRIKINYGKEYGISIGRSLEKGSIITLRIPVFKEKGD